MLSASEIILMAFDARARGDVRRVLKLMDPDVVALTIAGGETLVGAAEVAHVFAREAHGGRRVQVDAHRLEEQDDGWVHVFGRIRVHEHGTLADSPAAWRFAVRRGRILRIAPLRAGERAPAHAHAA